MLIFEKGLFKYFKICRIGKVLYGTIDWHIKNNNNQIPTRRVRGIERSQAYGPMTIDRKAIDRQTIDRQDKLIDKTNFLNFHINISLKSTIK